MMLRSPQQIMEVRDEKRKKEENKKHMTRRRARSNISGIDLWCNFFVSVYRIIMIIIKEKKYKMIDY